MRNPRNENLAEPTRTCILGREHAARDTLVRLALGPDGRVLPDVRARAPGRGAWIGVTQAELTAAAGPKGKLRGALARGEESLVEQVAGLWSRRTDRYSELRGEREAAQGRHVEMFLIGG